MKRNVAGPRRRRGRPRVLDGAVKRTVRLTRAQADWLAQRGDYNALIRAAVQGLMQGSDHAKE